MNKAFVLLALLAVSFAVTTERVTENNAADQLVNEISRMEGDINQEQAAHNELHSAQQAECDAEIAFRTSEVHDGEVAFAASQAALARASSALTASESDLQKAQNYVAAIHDILQNLASSRAAELASFTSLVNEELHPAIAAVEGAYPILRDFASQATNFVQFSGHLNKIFIHMLKTNQANSFAAMVNVLLQTPDWQNGISGDVIRNLETLFDNLLDDLNKALDHATAVENESVRVYEQTVAEYNTVLSDLHVTIESLTNYINALTATIADETGVSAAADAKVLHNNDSLNHAVDMCHAFETEWVNSTNARNEELNLLTQLKVFVREQEDIFGNFGNDGVNAFEEFRNKFFVQRQQSREIFLKSTLKNSKKNALLQRSAPQPIKCKSCKKSFVQKKLGF